MVPHPGRGILTPATAAIAAVTFALGVASAFVGFIPAYRESEAALQTPIVHRRIAEIEADNLQKVKEIEAENLKEVAKINGEYLRVKAELDNYQQRAGTDQFSKP